jgi:hypothetical protein
MSALRAMLAAAMAVAALPAAAADLCALLAKHGPTVFGTPLQAPPQCDALGPTRSAAANNASGSDRLEISVIEMSGIAQQAIDQERRDTREDRKVSDEPGLGRNAVLVRTDKGRVAVFHIDDGKRLIRVGLRARDGLNDAYVERARAFAKVVKAAQ